jgi:molybdopterin/thiamine biosynthesis adenylyltransferase
MFDTKIPFTVTITETADGTLITANHDVVVDWSDQTGWFNPEQVKKPVTIIGCGGIGSNVAFEMVTLGFGDYVLYDNDVVEERNLASQKAYRRRDLYRPKVEALAEILIEYGARQVLIRKRLFTADDEITGDVVIGAVDSMRSRQAIWQAVELSDAQIYLDGRLDGEVAQICAVEPLDADWYTSQWLFDDEAATKGGNCTMRVVVYPATEMAAIMCRHLGNWHRGEPICRFWQSDCANLEVTLIGNIEEKM